MRLLRKAKHCGPCRKKKEAWGLVAHISQFWHKETAKIDCKCKSTTNVFTYWVCFCSLWNRQSWLSNHTNQFLNPIQFQPSIAFKHHHWFIPIIYFPNKIKQITRDNNIFYCSYITIFRLHIVIIVQECKNMLLLRLKKYN